MDKLQLKEWKEFSNKVKNLKNDKEKINYLTSYIKELLFRVLVIESNNHK